MPGMNFSDLERRYGYVVALSMLMDMERHVRLNSALLADLDPDARFQTASALMAKSGDIEEVITSMPAFNAVAETTAKRFM